ncbi:Site-specific DNA-methyltransferase (adenine-spe cific) [Micromonospora noduli]|uniref:site-specific DNA-methyltransferase (adenine-specific) n=1 Tax=Micromonospora noduli TaxID=709876 RepID=A0ABX9D252_9ACTN|nr:class I SAM-dependent DNA methyltransferase [Micromonospora noduli]RAO19595.1 Site-specific DNA-methyltransferase (adenine-spe cific) [Micromonospora noduli]
MSSEAKDLSALVWSIGDLLRGDYRPSEYASVVEPFTLLRRLDLLLQPTKDEVVHLFGRLRAEGFADLEAVLRETTGLPFYNTSQLSFQSVVSDPMEVARNLRYHIAGYSDLIADVLRAYDFDRQISRLDKARLLYPVVSRFADVDLGPQAVSDRRMGAVFEELVQAFAAANYDAAGENFTPRDVVRVMAELLVPQDKGTGRRTVHDPACGIGGALLETRRQIEVSNPSAAVETFGQEINARTYAICRSNMLMRGDGGGRFVHGNSLSQDGFPDEVFDYLISAPPFGLNWRNAQDVVKHEAEMLGFSGRFGAGLPRIGDGSLLFLQHMVAKMKRPEDGGSRVGILFSGSPLDVGGPGSGESEIRRWILENDLLEGIVALPEQLLYSTAIEPYYWILTNRKDGERRGRVVLLNARDEWQQMRQSRGRKRRYLAPDQIAAVIDAYQHAAAIARDPQHPWNARVRLLRTEEFAVSRVVIDRPLRARFDLTEASARRLVTEAPFRKVFGRETLAEPLRQLTGSSWATRNKALGVLRAAVRDAGETWPTTAGFQNAVSRLLRVPDPVGEIQKNGRDIEADPALSTTVDLPAHRDPHDYLRDEAWPTDPDAWIDPAKTRLGYEISPTLFFVARINGDFASLKRFARRETARVRVVGEGNGWRHLSARDLHDVESAAALPEASESRLPMTVCRGSDLVGWPGNWRLLPPNFGEALTPMFVLHPAKGCGRLLCEWLNSRPEDSPAALRMTGRKLMDIQVPVDLFDGEIEDHLEAVQESRRRIQAAASNTLPNVFSGGQTDVHRLRDEIRSAASEAALVADLMRPVEDPVGRAEWTYPFHIASLARRYRISTHPAEQQDGLLKLGEGIARVLGILALGELIADQGGFTAALRGQLRTGATFGTWTTFIGRFADSAVTPLLADLGRLRDVGGVRDVLAAIKQVRNRTHHSHGVRAHHEIEKDVETLEPHVISALTTANWLAANPWDWVERCEYLDDSSYRIVGLTLRGSHPSWEPFDRPSLSPLRPNRIYVNGAGGNPVDLWPLAAVSLCPQCHTRELFLLNQCQDETLILRSLEEHELEIGHPLTAPA